MPDRPSRRTVLRGMAAATLSRAGVASARAQGAAYTVSVRPAHALLGERVIATLSVTAARTEVTTFDDPSLMLELRRVPGGGDPVGTFPNRRAVAVGDRIERLAGAPARQRLPPGQRLSRAFDLVEVFPRWALDTGDLRVGFELETAEGTARPPAASLVIESGPAAVGKLFDLLDHPRADVRTRAAGLLHRMTGHVAGWGAADEAASRAEGRARWRQWWESVGRRLPWSFDTAGAILDAPPTPAGSRSPGGPGRPAPRGGRSQQLGGVRYGRRSLGPGDTAALTGALSAWMSDPARGPAALGGSALVAEHGIAYPPAGVLLAPSAEVAAALAAALARLGEQARASAAEPPAVAILLATAARMPDRGLIPPLDALETQARGRAGWRRGATLARELLDVLDGARTPTGPAG